MNLRNQNPALILIDVQQAFLDHDYWGGNRNNIDAEAVCGQLLFKWRELKLPIFHIRHASADPDSLLHESKPGFDFNSHVTPLNQEVTIIKSVNSAFIDTGLHRQLKNAGITTLVIAGLTTNHCVSTTTRMAGNFGFETYLISDACATFDRVGVNGEKYDAQTIHNMTLANLNNEFATIWDSKNLLSEL